MASSAEKGKNIVLRSRNGEEFEVEESTARQSEVIGNVIDDGCAEDGIPLPIVDTRTLAKVIEYCRKHAGATSELGDDGNADEEIKSWDAAYIDVHLDVLFDLLRASNFLNIPGLLDLACKKLANMIKGKSVEEIRRTFNIQNDFTPEEEEEIRKQNQWAFE
ncbi:SKP1-like protein 1 [Phoenix dactylifera]|uniref:SKP1-like protein n=1 Tax=Phoenix dactylifera TaxID=42345 RepID=A0A8B7C517_PHODC|nr:SKP1-like protein 1 [Phoenix dactylifera]